MKKFISLALTAAMVASLVPATAFAKTKDGDTINGTVSVVNAWNENKSWDASADKGIVKNPNAPEVQIRVGDVDIQGTNPGKLARFTVRLDNANFFDEDDVDTAAGREKARKAFNDGKYATVTPNPQGVAGDLGSNKFTSYWYDALSDAEIATLKSDLYNAYVNDNVAGFNTKYSDVVIAKVGDMGTAGGTKEAYENNQTDAATAAKDGDVANAKQLNDAATETSIVSGEKAPATVANLVGNSMVPASTVAFAKPALNVDTVRTEVFKVASVSAAGGPNHDGAAVIVTVASAKYVANDLFDRGAGWIEAGAETDVTKFVSEKAVVDFMKGHTSNFNAVTIGGKAQNLMNAISGDSLTGLAGTPDTKDNFVADAGFDFSTNNVYREKTVSAGIDRPIYGLDRKSLRIYIADEKDVRANEITFTVDNPEFPEEGFLEKGDIISIDLISELVNKSKDASVSITSEDFTLTNDNADITYVNVDKEALQLSIRKVVDVAEDEVVTLDDKGLLIKANVGSLYRNGGENEINLKISKGFEFVVKALDNNDGGKDFSIVARKDGDIVTDAVIINPATDKTNKEEITLNVLKDINEIAIYGIDVKAASAKIDKVATIKATAIGFNASAAVEVAKVVDYIVMLSVDEDEDVPVIYSGVDVDNYGITDDSDHWSLEVTAKESFPGAWSFRKGFNFELPDHVFVTDVDVVSTENFLKTPEKAEENANEVQNDHVYEAFFNAYQNGSHVNFEFDKRIFDDVDAKLTDDPAEMTFRLQLVMDTGYEGDVPLKLTGELLDEQEVIIAKFVKPYEAKAEQNDMIIDYRYTDIPTAITITEAEAGLWDKDKAYFEFIMEKADKTFLAFEDATFTVDSKSGMEIDDDVNKEDGIIKFTVKGESDEAATITIDGIQMFMNRSIPAGPYDLTIESSLNENYLAETLFAPDFYEYNFKTEDACRTYMKNNQIVQAPDDDNYVEHVDDIMDTVKEGFINVVTAGRDVDDASFTTKVVVPVGENYIVAGEKQIELDTPAYINASGYTMLPIRAVATALGINNNNVLWDQPTKTVTILYGQRIITMTQGQKVVYVNGSAIPASAAVENTNSRTFLPMRDLATALGVTDIEWNQATRTATLNGNQKGNQ